MDADNDPGYGKQPTSHILMSQMKGEHTTIRDTACYAAGIEIFIPYKFCSTKLHPVMQGEYFKINKISG